MNLHAIVRGAINAVNPDISVSIKYSNGYATSSNGVQAPSYSTVTGIIAQMQPVSTNDLRHLDGLNISDDVRGFWLNGSTGGVNRPLNKGGDLITLADNSSWLVVAVPENWSPTAGWCHVIAKRQM